MITLYVSNFSLLEHPLLIDFSGGSCFCSSSLKRGYSRCPEDDLKIKQCFQGSFLSEVQYPLKIPSIMSHQRDNKTNGH